MTRFVIGGLLCVTLFAADPRWVRMRSPHFELYASANEKDARDTLRHFERVREFFIQQMLGAPKNELPVIIVGFGSKKEYEPYRFNEFSPAYYHSTSRRDFIVLNQLGSESFSAATHEYVHLLIRHAGLKLPPWLNEGLAEFYSTMRPFSGEVLVGGVIEGRRQALRYDRWVPLAEILAAGPAYINEKDRAGGLYNEGWALTHMLIRSPDYRDQFPKLLAAIVDGQPSTDALPQIYGKPLQQIDKDLQIYMAGDRFRGALLAMPAESAEQQISAEPAVMFDVNVVLAELIDRPGNENAARKRAEALTAENPKRPEPWIELGFLAERRHDNEEARDDLAKAYALGSREPELLYHFGVLFQRSNMAEAASALAELVRQQPDRTEARLVLASVQLALHKPEEAVKALSPVHQVPADQGTRYFSLLAHAQQQSGDLKSARESAGHLLEVARLPSEREDADRLLSYLNTLEAREAGPAPQYTVRHDLPTIKAPVQPETLAHLRGMFLELDCFGDQPRVVVSNDGKKMVFLMDNPHAIKSGGGTVELKCGPQKPIAVDIGFLPADARHPSVDGLIREFRPAQ